MQPSCFLTVDAVVIFRNEVLLVRRKNEPFKGKWAFPGGFVEQGEKTLDAARRELEEETGVMNVPLVQFAAYGDPGRDPRGRTVTIVYLAFPEKKPSAKAADDAAACDWFSFQKLPPMAFDHGQILSDIRKHLSK